MRAIESLILYKRGIPNYDTVKEVILKLYSLRENQIKTYEYINHHLYADARWRRLTNNFNGELVRGDFKEYEGEIDFMKAYCVRSQVLKVVKFDKTFIYAHNILAEGKNEYISTKKVSIADMWEYNSNTASNITYQIRCNREDYPKNDFNSFLEDDDNFAYYEKWEEEINENDDWWLNVYNLAYEAFDKLRIYAFNNNVLSEIVNNISSGDSQTEKTVFEILDYLFDSCKAKCSEKQASRFRVIHRRIKNKIKRLHVPTVMVAEPAETISENIKNDVPVMTCPQQTIAFVYILNHFGVSAVDTNHIDIARFVKPFTGRSLDNIRKNVRFDIDDENVRSNMRVAEKAVRRFMPEIADQILRDLNVK